MKTSVDAKDRIAQVTHELCPDCSVVFDADAGNYIRFRIEDSSARILTRGYPHWHPDEIEGWSDKTLREVIRELCGGRI
jgi:hypothetical protein